jgi:GT2 family glycosyltransferase
MSNPANRPGHSADGSRFTASLHTAVIIPNWNGQEHLARCLPALSAQTCQDFQLVVVDNGSTDGSVAWVRQWYPSAEIIALDRNQGFAAACNAGIRATSSELVVTLNNDTVPEPDWLALLLDGVEQYPEAGMFASTLWLDREPPLVDAAGLEINRLGVAWNVGRGLPVTGLAVEPVNVFGPCGGAALYRRQLLEDVGLFDESYFAYLEDAELAWRARWAGWTGMAIPTSIVSHIHSATGGRTLPQKYWLLGRNRLWTLLRHYPRPHLWYHLPLILLNEVLTGLLGAIALRNPAPLRGRLYALGHWRVGTQPRFRAPRRLSASEAFALLTPLPSPRKLLSQYAVHGHRTRQQP